MKKLKNLGRVLSNQQLKETHGGFSPLPQPPVNCECLCGNQVTVCHGFCLDGTAPQPIPGSCDNDGGGPALPL